jgi:5-formyltetrahydrofolate cyclo-ligase
LKISERSKRHWRAGLDEKAIVRQEILKKRDTLDSRIRRRKDLLIKERLFSLTEFRQAEIILHFASFRSEVSTLPQIEEALRLGKRIFLPRVDRNLKRLDLYEVMDIMEISPGYLGIPEPDLPKERQRGVNDADLVITPGAAFDPRGHRLGYGGGYYDRLLSELEQGIPLIAVAYEEQVLTSVPFEAHDVRVHMIVTDERVIDCRRT